MRSKRVTCDFTVWRRRDA